MKTKIAENLLTKCDKIIVIKILVIPFAASLLYKKALILANCSSVIVLNFSNVVSGQIISPQWLIHQLRNAEPILTEYA